MGRRAVECALTTEHSRQRDESVSDRSPTAMIRSHDDAGIPGRELRTESTTERRAPLDPTVASRAPASGGATGHLPQTGRNLGVLAVAALAVAMTALTAWTVVRDVGTTSAPSTPNPAVPGPTSGGTTGGSTQTAGPESRTGFTTDSEVSGAGGVRASAHVVFDRPVSSMTIAVTGANTAWLAGDFHPRVADLVVTAAGAPVSDASEALAAGDSVKVDLPPGTTAVDMTYRARGVMIRTTPSVSSRALVLVNPVVVSGGSPLAAHVHVVGADILNLGCSGPSVLAAACGTPSSDGWRVRNPARSGEVAVVAQVDLPRQR